MWQNLTKGKKAATVIAAFLIVVLIGSALGSTQQTNSTKQNAEKQATSGQTSQATDSNTPKATNQLKVHYIDVGQGDSEFLELPDGRAMLIDAGTSSSGTAVVNYVKSLGYSKIDYVVASHPHEDHIGGLPSVINAFDIGEIWAPKISTTTQAYETFLDTVAAKNLVINSASSGKKIGSSTSYYAEILSPSENSVYTDLNDWSAVIKIQYGGKSFLFTGDAGTAVLSSIISSHIDVLKVAHHGSDTGTTKALVSRITPTYAVISCGADNSYGHPTTSVLESLSSVSVYRTDKQKTIIATCKDGKITFNVSPLPYQAPVVAAPSTVAPQATQPAPSTSSITVYKTATGEKYHMDGCRYLSKSKIAVSLESAKAQGLTACSVCRPPS